MLKILFAEDNPVDAELVLRQLRRDGFEFEVNRVETEEAFLAGLRPDLDLILSDYDLGAFNGLRALEIVRARGVAVPFILISGTIGEDVAVQAIKLGASDYLLKDRLARLGTAVTQAIMESRLRHERSEAERSLAISESRYRLLVEQASDGIFTMARDGRCSDVNARALEMMQYSRDEFLRLKLGDLIDPEERSRLDAEIERLRHGGSRVSEFRICRKDGTWFDAEISARALPDGHLIGIVRDLTERRRAEQALRDSEERFRQIAENIHEVFWMNDPAQHRVLYVSPAYETVWGRRCEELLACPTDWLQAIHPDDRDRVAKAAATRQLSGDYHEIYRVVRPDGTIRWVRDRAFPIRDAQGKVYRVVGTAEDITEHRKLEDQFLQAQKMEAVGTLAGGIAHDFNNILAAITGYSELMRMQIKDQPEVNGYLDALLQASARATSLVRQILAFSRQGEHARKPVDLSQVVAEPLALLRATIPATVAFDLDLPENLPPVLADETHIHQIVMNLGTNAAHAMKDHPGTLGVKVGLCEVTEEFAKTTERLRPGPHLVLTVSDTGKGMTPELMKRMFEPFFTTKGPGEGTGLGLAVVHGVMQTHEGEVTVKSKPGKGTTFQLYFPAYLTPVPDQPAGPEGAPPRGRGERILFVDDEAPIMMVGRLMLEQLGYQVEGGTDALEMLERFKETPHAFDLVITDLTMPGITGVEFARRLLEIRSDIRIIVTTGYNATLTLERMRQLGIHELIMKPLSMHSLATTLRHALDGQVAPPGKSA